MHAAEWMWQGSGTLMIRLYKENTKQHLVEWLPRLCTATINNEALCTDMYPCISQVLIFKLPMHISSFHVRIKDRINGLLNSKCIFTETYTAACFVVHMLHWIACILTLIRNIGFITIYSVAECKLTPQKGQITLVLYARSVYATYALA